MRDPRPTGRLRDPQLLRRLHLEFDECVVCGAVYGLTLHHLLSRAQGGDDVRANLISLCMGNGVSDCHGKLHSGDRAVREEIRRHLSDESISYLLERKGRDWLNRFYPKA